MLFAKPRVYARILWRDSSISKSIPPPFMPRRNTKRKGYIILKHLIAVLFIAPGKSMQNEYVESFNGRLRDECFNGPRRAHTERTLRPDLEWTTT